MNPPDDLAAPLRPDTDALDDAWPPPALPWPAPDIDSTVGTLKPTHLIDERERDEDPFGPAIDTATAPDVADPDSVDTDAIDTELDDTELVDTEPETVEPEPRTDRLPRVGSVLVAIIVIAARYVFAMDRTIYQLAPDEPGSLAMSRWLSGGVRFTMFDYNTWRPGLAILLAPVNAFTDDPQQLMRGAFVINAVLAAMSTLLLARLAVRLTNLPTWACLFSAAVISLTASSLSASAHVWAESLVTLSTLWLILAAIQFFDEPRLAPALSASTAVAVGVVSHGRLLPMLPVVAVLVVFGFVRTRQLKPLVVWTPYTALVCGGAMGFTNWVFSHVWDTPGGTNTVGTVLNRSVNVPAVGQSLVGQLWYQLVVTFGVFGVGVAILAWHAIGRRPNVPLARDARVILLVTLPLILTSVVFMSGRDRTDHRIYGRYNDAIVWPVLIVGIGWLASRIPWKRRLAMLTGVIAATVGTGALVYALDGTAMSKSVGVRPMIAGFLPLVGTSPNLDPWLLTAYGVVGTLLVFWFLAIRRLTPLTVTAVIALLVVGGYRTHEALATRLNSWAAAGEVVEIDEVVAPDVPLAFKFVPEKEKPKASWVEQRRRALLYQVYLPEHRFERDEGVDDGGSPYVFAPLGDPEMTKEGATLVWTDPTVKIGLWVEPGAPYIKQ